MPLMTIRSCSRVAVVISWITAVALLACGPKTSRQPTSGPDIGDKSTMMELKKFHDAIVAPVPAAGDEAARADACRGIPSIEANAEALAKASPPSTTDMESWATATKDLREDVASVNAACNAGDLSASQQALSRLHNGFRVVEMI